MEPKTPYFYKFDFLPWLLALACADFLSMVMLWLADVRAFGILALANTLSTLLLFACVFAYTHKRSLKKEAAFRKFLESPKQMPEDRAARLANRWEAGMIREIGGMLRESEATLQKLSLDLEDYEEYVEAWAHEVKTPISLLTFLLDNHREELPPEAAKKLDYVQSRMQEQVSQMLYYARLKSVHKDYRLEPLDLAECCQEALEDYSPLLGAYGFCLSLDVKGIQVLSDQRGLAFLLRQVISNSIKYCRREGKRQIRIWASPPASPSDRILLHIQDNGIGAQPCDLPFLFDKGFTGESGSSRKKATGMGLYLAKAVADDLNIGLDAQSKWGEGFEALLSFPQIESIR